MQKPAPPATIEFTIKAKKLGNVIGNHRVVEDRSGLEIADLVLEWIAEH